MKKLTENLIQQRLKSCTTDLDKVLQINVTGRELEDVSLLRNMTGVEILSLSVNQISSLQDFQFCKNLKELYLRHNKIADLNQIFYLKNLSKLELLMLSQNPCAENPLYRMTVIKNLKNLKELDGAPVTLEERRQAHKLGLEVTLNGESHGAAENFIPDGPQIERTPTPSTQKFKSDENLGATTEMKTHCKTIDENAEESILKTEPEECRSAISPAVKKEKKHLIQDETPPPPPPSPPKLNVYVNEEELINARALCKNCGNNCTTDTAHCVAFIPNNTNNANIVSAVLNLIKELDYSGLQIINAEVASRLNAFELEFICQRKPFLARSRIKDMMHV